MTCICNSFVPTTSNSVVGTQLILSIPQATYNNGDVIYLYIAQPLTSALSDLSVAIQIGTGTTYYPLVKVCSNNVRADQLRTRTIYKLTVMTDPGHFVVNGSKCLPCSIFTPPQIPEATTDAG